MNAKVQANGARGGHPRTVPYSKMSPKGRIELRISQSRAKFDQEVAGDVRFYVAHQKAGENVKKLIFFSEKFSPTFFFLWSQNETSSQARAGKRSLKENFYFVETHIRGRNPISNEGRKSERKEQTISFSTTTE